MSGKSLLLIGDTNKELFKDEVRQVGKELGLPNEVIHRHPFPGPGLAVRVIGPISQRRLELLREADWILIDQIKDAGLYAELWQSFCVLLPIKTVGVMSDERTYVVYDISSKPPQHY